MNGDLMKQSAVEKTKLPIRYYRALKRNLYETRWAIWERSALMGLHRAKSFHEMDFFYVSSTALFNDMISHAIKILDRNKQSASFWYLYRCQSITVNALAKNNSNDFALIEQLSDKLKKVRDETHFHIDCDAVFDPHLVWSNAGITWKEFEKVLNFIWKILQYLHEESYSKKFIMPKYDGSDATALIKIAQEKGIIPLYVKKGLYISDIED